MYSPAVNVSLLQTTFPAGKYTLLCFTISVFNACRILMHSNKEYPPVLEWNFNSLKLAIDTMFALNETSERKWYWNSKEYSEFFINCIISS